MTDKTKAEEVVHKVTLSMAGMEDRHRQLLVEILLHMAAPQKNPDYAPVTDCLRRLAKMVNSTLPETVEEPEAPKLILVP